MNFRKTGTAAIVAIGQLCFALPVSAHDDPVVFEQRVIEVLLKRPELVLAALSIVQQREAIEKAAAEKERITSVATDVFQSGGAGNLSEDQTPLLAEFFDYRCGYCARASLVTEAFADANDQRVRLLEFPILGPESEAIAKLAIGLRNTYGISAYRAFHNRMFEDDVEPKTPQTALQIMVLAGHDAAAIETASRHDDVTKELQRNKAWALQLGVNGTPAYLTANGVAAGMQTREDLEALIKGTTP